MRLVSGTKAAPSEGSFCTRSSGQAPSHQKSNDTDGRSEFNSSLREDHLKTQTIPRHIKNLVDADGLSALQSLFSVFDSSGDGFMSADELGNCLRASGFNPTSYEIQDVFAEFDKDRNGDLDFNEFVVLWHRYCQRNRVSNEIYVRRAFEFLDTDDMKTILLGEFTSVMTEIGEPLTRDELEKLFKLVDIRQEGMFYIDEFFKVNAEQAIADRVFEKAMGVADTSRQSQMMNIRPEQSKPPQPNLSGLMKRFMGKHRLKIFKT